MPNCIEKYDNSKVYYGYDKAKNVTNILNLSLNNDLIDSYRYEYDACNRIIEERYEDNIYNASFKIKYTYDQFGNILTKEDVLQGEIYTYEYAESNPFLLQKIKLIKNNEDLGYVINTQYHEDYPLIVKSITINNETKNIIYQDGLITQIGEIKFEYNAFGQRIVKSADNITTYYYYDNKNLIRSSRDGINTFYIYDDNNQLLGLRYNNEVYLYDKDMLGNIIGIIDKTGKLMIKFSYTAFGVPIINYSVALSQEELLVAQDIVLNNVFLYKGYIYDGECAMYWLSSRFYVPELGRFLTPDDIKYLDSESINGLNLYCYCKNNPIMYADPSGHFTIAALIISFVASVAFEIIEDAIDGELFTDDSHDWKDYLGAGISGILGGMSGKAGVVLGLFGDLADAVISGDLAENGLDATLKSIVISNFLSFGTEFVVKGMFNSKQIRKLTSDAHANKKIVKSLGGSFSFKKNGKSIKAFKNAIKSTDWAAKTYTAQLLGELVSSSFSLFLF